jgi:5-methyltetrahydrofolate--homocysteine methyltransferase
VRWRTLPASAPGKVGSRANLYGVTKGFLDSLSDRVLVADGAMGTMLHAADPSVDDYQGHEGCSEILSVTLPDVVRGIHDAYFAAGADCVETNTFGANLSALAEYGLADRIFELSQPGRGWPARWPTATPPRPAAVCPRLDGARHQAAYAGPRTYATLRDAYQQNAAGLLAGGADVLIVETCQDLLQTKAAVVGAGGPSRRPAVRPVICHVTVETTGTMLLGSEIGAALTALEPLGIDLIGLNCATGRPRCPSTCATCRSTRGCRCR